MHSLQRLISLKAQKIYPGHGPVIENATNVVEKYVEHRNLREKQVLFYLFLPIFFIFPVVSEINSNNSPFF